MTDDEEDRFEQLANLLPIWRDGKFRCTHCGAEHVGIVTKLTEVVECGSCSRFESRLLD